MNTTNKPFKFKNIPYYLILSLLTAGASLILGLLSFGGMYALYGMISLAFGAFILSVIYEGEIYLQNIRNAYQKLFKSNHLENELAKEFLLENFPKDTHSADCPKFFKDYMTQLQLLKQFGHLTLDAKSQARKAKIEKTLKDMEKWFAQVLFNKKAEHERDSLYKRELLEWVKKNDQIKWLETLETRRITSHGVVAFSTVSALFMTLGTTYLMVEAFSVLPFVVATIPFGFWPAIILPTSIIAGLAYGMLTYNAMTDFFNNNTIVKWFNKLKEDLNKEITARTVFMTIAAVFLGALAVALTICTAGTWWTIATQSRPLFEWMSKIPSFVMGVINPIVNGLSAVIFIFQNTGESLEMVDELTQTKENPFVTFYESLKTAFAHVQATENWWQILNPFRILAKLIITPLRLLLFMGHLISIAVTADRVPGIPEIIAAIVAIISEGFEDAHYFFSKGHSHHEHEHHHHDCHDHEMEENRHLLEDHLRTEHGHNHDNDIPTKVLYWVAHIFYLPAAIWDYLFSLLNEAIGQGPRALTFTEAWNKQSGVPIEHEVQLDPNAKRPSFAWQKEHTTSLIQKHQSKHLEGAIIGQDIAENKSKELDALAIRVNHAKSRKDLKNILANEKVQPRSYNQHRMFASDDKTRTELFIDELAERVDCVSAA